MRQAFMDLPVELEAAALVDGASAFQAFTNIALRLAAPAYGGDPDDRTGVQLE
jgi:ABC-type glycerol-3-phosphate transport system permease component